MQTIYQILFIFFTGLPLMLYSQEYVGVKEVYRYTANPQKNEVVLQMDYASSIVKNPESWTSGGIKVAKEITIVFTKYPLKPKHWITNYDSLLIGRKQAIGKLIPGVLSDKNIRWNYIVQNSCTNEIQAKQLFHGAIIKYITPEQNPISKNAVKRDSIPKAKVVYKELPIDFGIKDLVNGKYEFADSIVFKVFNRHPEWKNMLVVNDWTGSMYEFGAQTVLWNKINIDKKAVKQFVFFNDGDKKRDFKKQIGSTGGIYFCNPDNLNNLVETMNKVMENGYGGDMPENDIEAIIAGIKRTKDFGEVVLIADNRSPVRDIALLDKVNVPVRVILCGSSTNGTILPDYLEIAKKTNGSVHTIKEDIDNLSRLQNGDQIVMLNIPYVYLNGRFEKMSIKTSSDNSRIN